VIGLPEFDDGLSDLFAIEWQCPMETNTAYWSAHGCAPSSMDRGQMIFTTICLAEGQEFAPVAKIAANYPLLG